MIDRLIAFAPFIRAMATPVTTAHATIEEVLRCEHKKSRFSVIVTTFLQPDSHAQLISDRRGPPIGRGEFRLSASGLKAALPDPRPQSLDIEISFIPRPLVAICL